MFMPKYKYNKYYKVEFWFFTSGLNTFIYSELLSNFAKSMFAKIMKYNYIITKIAYETFTLS